MAGNKSDLFQNEEVREAEARDYAKEIGAFFRLTSALSSSGIDELFRSIGSKVLDPNFKDEENSDENSGNNGNNNRGFNLEGENGKNGQIKKKSWC